MGIPAENVVRMREAFCRSSHSSAGPARSRQSISTTGVLSEGGRSSKEYMILLHDPGEMSLELRKSGIKSRNP